jgi:hypothetical protein
MGGQYQIQHAQQDTNVLLVISLIIAGVLQAGVVSNQDIRRGVLE